MGRPCYGTVPTDKKVVSLFRVRLCACYDDGGAYWGYPSYNLWCARATEHDYQQFVRAPTRQDAAKELGLTNDNLMRGV
jgi:hypothetical protein